MQIRSTRLRSTPRQCRFGLGDGSLEDWFLFWWEYKLCTEFVQIASRDEIKRSPDLFMYAGESIVVCRIAKITCGIERFLHA